MSFKKKIQIGISAFLALISGIVFYNSKEKLGVALVEIPRQIIVGSTYIKKGIDGTETQLNDKTSYDNLFGTLKQGEQAYSKYLFATNNLSDNQYYKTGNTNVGSTSPEVRYKPAGEPEKTDYEKNLLSVKALDFLFGTPLTALSATPVVEASSTGYCAGACASLVYALTIPGSLTNPVLFISAFDNNDLTAVLSVFASGLTLSPGGGDRTSNNKATFWTYTLNPSATTTNIKIDITGGAGGRIWSTAVVVSGVSQTAPVSASSTLRLSVTNVNVQVQTVTDELLLQSMIYESSSVLNAFGVGQISVCGFMPGDGQNNLLCDKKVATSTAQTTMYETLSTADRTTGTLLSISEPAAAVAAPAANEDIFIFE